MTVMVAVIVGAVAAVVFGVIGFWVGFSAGPVNVGEEDLDE